MPVINPKDIDPFVAPIPGQGLTSEIGSRPWQRPPELPTIEMVLSFYADRFSDPKIASTSVSLMESGIPITNLSETLMTANVMEGKHSIDTGMLAIPFIVELLEYLAKEANIKYILGDEEEEDDSILKSIAAQKAFREFEEETGRGTKMETKEDTPLKEDSVEQTSQTQVENTKSEPNGLMSRGEM